MTAKRNMLTDLKGSGPYWLLQLIGWGGMVLLEVINYTFFLVGEFSWQYLYTFSAYAFIGILITHISRVFFIRNDLFSRPSWIVWITGISSVIICSFLSVMLLLTPVLFSDEAGEGL